MKAVWPNFAKKQLEISCTFIRLSCIFSNGAAASIGSDIRANTQIKGKLEE